MLATAFAALKCERWGGPSVNGWSTLACYLRCPYRYYLRYECNKGSALVSDSSEAQDIGAYTHAILAAHYAAMLPDARYPGFRAPCPTPEALIKALWTAGAEPEAMQRAEALWRGYQEEYADEPFTPVAVEMPAGDVKRHTSRYDLVTWVEDGIHNGLWICEHKTAAASSDIELFNLDGEVMGEALSWRLSNLDPAFGGRLTGVVINVLLKSKTPTFRRLWLPIHWGLIEDFAANRALWQEARNAAKARCVWPKNYYGCASRFDRCLFWDHCATLDYKFLAPKAGSK